MPITYLSERGYGIVKEGNEELVDDLRSRLTVKPYVNPRAPAAVREVEFAIYCESGQKIYIPKSYGLSHFGVPTHDRLDDGDDAPSLVFNGALRPEQEEPVACFMEATRDPLRRGGIISIGCGNGKTVVALYIACQLKKKTIVVCHKSFLMDQWRERISQFVPDARVGLIKQAKVVTENCDIVLASLQSLAMRDYDKSVFKGFHFAIIDEIHHTSAEVFSRALPKITSPIMLGLSATLKRADGLSKVFEWHVGKPVFVSKRKDSSLKVMMMPYSHLSPDYGQEVTMWSGKPNVAQMITRLCSFPPRNRAILDALSSAIAQEPGRKTLILSDRRAHLSKLESMINNAGIGSVGYYVGGMKEQDLKHSEGKDIILGTFTMACLADTTIIVDPITGREYSLMDFENMPRDNKNFNMAALMSVNENTGTVHMSRSTNFGYSGKKPCKRIIHAMGDIIVSNDHQLYTPDGWKRADELTCSDYLITPRRLELGVKDIPTIHNHEMWALGCILAVGSTSLSGMVADIYIQLTNIVEESMVAKDIWNSVMAQAKFEQECYVVLDIMFMPEEKICSLVGGLFDGIGTVDGCTISFTIMGQRLANQLRTLLLRLHIRSTRTPCVKPGFPYVIIIAPEDVKRFINIIDVRGDETKKKLKNVYMIITEFAESVENTCPVLENEMLGCVEIYKIVDVDPSMVRLCDIEVPIYKNFIASDIIVHNSEGMDIPALNTLILASPVSSVEQPVGRIQRQKEEDRQYTPLVIDVWDQFSLFKSQGYRRINFYKKSGYDIAYKDTRDTDETGICI